MDTEPIYARVHKIVSGHELTWDLRRDVLGRTGPDACKLIVERLKLDETPLHYMERRDTELRKHFPDAKLFDGAREIVEYFLNKGMPVAIATSSPRVNFECKITHHRPFFSKFRSTICGDEISAGKPDPEIYTKSMQALGVSDPSTVLVIEDAPSGVRAANNAGMPVVMVPDPELPLHEGLADYGAKPDFIFKTLRDIDVGLFALSPPLGE